MENWALSRLTKFCTATSTHTTEPGAPLASLTVRAKLKGLVTHTSPGTALTPTLNPLEAAVITSMLQGNSRKVISEQENGSPTAVKQTSKSTEPSGRVSPSTAIADQSTQRAPKRVLASSKLAALRPGRPKP